MKGKQLLLGLLFLVLVTAEVIQKQHKHLTHIDPHQPQPHHHHSHHSHIHKLKKLLSSV